MRRGDALTTLLPVLDQVQVGLRPLRELAGATRIAEAHDPALVLGQGVGADGLAGERAGLVEGGRFLADPTPGDVGLPEDVADLPGALVAVDLDEVEQIYIRFGELGIEVIDRPERYQNRDDSDAITLSFDKDETPEFVISEQEKTNDPVRMYLREMGTVPLLDREGEVEIAQRIEQGEWLVYEALCENPVVLKELLRLNELAEKDDRILRELIDSDPDEPLDPKAAQRIKGNLKIFDQSGTTVVKDIVIDEIRNENQSIIETWTGIDNAGQFVSSGTYLAELTAGDPFIPSKVSTTTALFSVNMFRLTDLNISSLLSGASDVATISYQLSQTMDTALNVYRL